MKHTEPAILLETLNPHFVFNALNTIKGAVLLQKEGANALVDDFSRYLRYLVNIAEHGNNVEMTDELKFTKAYTNIEQMRFPKLNMVYDIESADYRLPAFTLQKVVNEMIHKGILANPSGGTVRVRSGIEGKGHCLEIEHDGVEYEIEVPQWTQEHVEVSCGKRKIKIVIRGEKAL